MKNRVKGNQGRDRRSIVGWLSLFVLLGTVACDASNPTGNAPPETPPLEETDGESAAPDAVSEDSDPTGDTDVSSPAPDSIQALADGSYKFCSEPPSENAENVAGELEGYCYTFLKQGDRLVGDYYDSRTLGEVSVCVEGEVDDNVLVGEGFELIGNIGRQELPPEFEGDQLVNWDDPDYLQVAQAEQIGTNEFGGQEVRYEQVRLNLSEFYRYDEEINVDAADCLTRIRG